MEVDNLRFAAPCTCLVPPGVPFKFVNLGLLPLQLIVVCTQRPVPAASVAGHAPG